MLMVKVGAFDAMQGRGGKCVGQSFSTSCVISSSEVQSRWGDARQGRSCTLICSCCLQQCHALLASCLHTCGTPIRGGAAMLAAVIVRICSPHPAERMLRVSLAGAQQPQ
jgi:hypothetical protein